MHTSSIIQKNLARILLISFGSLANYAAANGGQATAHRASIQKAPAAVAVKGNLPKLPSDVTDLKFREFFKMPIGPRGLDPSEKLMALAGKRVRLIGYMARQETPTAGFFILAPLPVALGDQDEALSDDLPASTVFVHVAQPAQALPTDAVPHYAGLLRLTGILSLGPLEEADGHVSTVRLQLDPELVQAMTPSPGGS